MEKLTSIMAAVEHPDSASAVIEKAVVLAGIFHARLELLVIEPLRKSAIVPGCVPTGLPQLTVHAVPRAGEPVHSLLLRRARECQPDLLIKAPAGAHPLRRWALTPNDWELSQRSPMPLMLATSRLWANPARFAASVDVSDVGNMEIARSVLHTAGILAHGCRGNLDVLYTEREQDDEYIRMERAVRLAQLVREFHVGCERLQMFEGSPDKRLPPLFAARQYDVLVLGSISHRQDLGESLCPLTSRLVAATEGDVILVKGLSDEQRRAASGAHPAVISGEQQVPDQRQQFV